MYYYIVDPQKIAQREFERVQNNLYSSLSEYRISGEVMRVTGLRTVNQLVENAFSHGAKTIVAVGSDDTLHDVINAVRGRETIVGYIPIFNSEIGEMLGLKSIEQATRTIGQRRIAMIDLASVNNNYFLSRLTFGLSRDDSRGLSRIFNFKLISSLLSLPEFEVKFSANSEFEARMKVVGGIITASPTHGGLDVMLLPKLSNSKTLRYREAILSGEFQRIPEASIMHVEGIEISSPAGLPLKAGSRVIAKTPARIEVQPQALKIIVGKDRRF